MADTVYDLIAVQHGLQGAFGTGVAATKKYPGNATLQLEDAVVTPKRMTGEPGGMTVEDAIAASTGTLINLQDTELSAELMAFMGNMGIKTVGGPATSFPFVCPTTTTANSISYFTWEFATLAQEYEVADCILEAFNLHGDVNANEGRAFFNGRIGGRKATASTLTASLAPYVGHTPLNLNNATYFLDALGAAAYGATAVTGALRGFSLDVTKTGFERGRLMDGRTDLDYAAVIGGGQGYRMNGNLKLLIGSHAVTQIANARAGTGKLISISIGSSTRIVQINLPIVFGGVPAIGATNEQGMLLAEFPFTVGHSRTTTVHGPEINVTVPSLTIT